MAISQMEDTFKHSVNRLFYLALPPEVFEPVSSNLHAHCMSRQGAWTRVIIEKPFGYDDVSSAKLSNHLAGLFDESQIYRIDRELGRVGYFLLLFLKFSKNPFVF